MNALSPRAAAAPCRYSGRCGGRCRLAPGTDPAALAALPCVVTMRQRDFFLYVVLAALLSLLAGWLVFEHTLQAGLRDLRGAMESRISLHAGALEREMERFGLLPLTASLNRDVADFLQAPPAARDVAEMNRYLKQLNASIGAQQAYLVDPGGQIVATSNWDRPDSFLGRDISYRPYVRNARPGRTEGFYGIGTTNNASGYFLATAVEQQGRRLGVVAIKIDLEQLEKPWRGAEYPVLLTDANDVVILASVPDWKYATLGPLSPAARQKLEETQQYNHRPLPALPWQPLRDLGEGLRLARLGEGGAAQDYLALARQMPGSGMNVTVLSEPGDLYSLAWARAVAAMVMVAFASVLLHAFRLWRDATRERLAAREALQAAHDHLELQVEQRSAELRAANAGLRREVQERIQAVRRLESAQEELIRTENLAVIGQLSAGLAHEINQPLAALSTLSANAVRFLERGDTETVRFNLGRITDLVARLGTLTGQLRSFARRSTGEAEPLPLAQRIESAAALLGHRLEKDGVQLVLEPPPAAVVAQGEAVRLEQVLVNLIGNAADAVAEQTEKRIRIRWWQEGGAACVTVSDNGPGMSGAVLERLFEPFFTTKKSSGLGLGLAISSDIMRRLGGSLEAANRPEGGAVFTLRLPAAAMESKRA
ncbi:ATP-binding protein [Roseomonas sp. GC11]|uniref:sensor histidine kinase n=1 Tax=Roseomonas sp. GC11 TaxID=2950546 RepID=UPI00210E750C|nr:ATP-binding protein [Roseomonas sp. GC11]